MSDANVADTSTGAGIVSMGSFGAPNADRKWSAQQQAIFDWFRNPAPLTASISQHLYEKERPAREYRNLVVRARAGTGKTTTIIEAISYAPEQSILLCAFNKRIAVELSERLTNPNAEAATLHSVGFSAVKRYWERVRVDMDRAKVLTNMVVNPRVPDPIRRLISKLHTHGRELMPHATRGADLNELAVAYDCVPDEDWQMEGFTVEAVCGWAYAAMEAAAAEKPANGIDFADMLFLPVRNSWLRPRYDLVVVDEAQDMNATQLEIAQGVLKGRMAVVGDDRQAIYGFRGADSGSIDRLKRELGAAELGLTTTYRCGRVIVDQAAKLVPDFRAADEAPEGEISAIPFSKVVDVAAPGNFILSRTNAPLIRVALALIRQGRRTRIEGRDIGANLKAVARKLTTGKAQTSMPQWLTRLKVWELKEADRAERADLPGKADAIHDTADTLRALAEGVASVREIEGRIDSLFDDTGGAGSFIICSSVHRAKGLEADRVFVLRDTLNLAVACECGHRHLFGKCKCGCDNYQPAVSKKREEENIAYVAITRARKQLVWVEGK